MSQERETQAIVSAPKPPPESESETDTKAQPLKQLTVDDRINELESKKEKTDAEVIELSQLNAHKRAERKAKLATVLERGFLNDRLAVDLPSDVHGEWIRNDPLEIHRMEAMGFEVDRVHAPKRAIHDAGTETAVVGDVIFMTCDKETKVMIDEIRHENFIRMNSPRESKEETEFANQVRAVIGDDVGAFVDSKTREARKADITDALRTLGEQVK